MWWKNIPHLCGGCCWTGTVTYGPTAWQGPCISWPLRSWFSSSSALGWRFRAPAAAPECLVLETRRKMEVSYGLFMKHGGFETFYMEKWWFNNETWKYSNEQWRFNYQKWWLEDKNCRLNPGKAFNRLKNPLVIQLASDNCQSEDLGISTGHLQWESIYKSLAIAAR